MVAAGCGSSSRREEHKPRPNVLIVVSDDERIESRIATPHTYSWFKGGTIFNRAYATTPHCCPSRVSIFTGQYVHNHKVHHQGKVRLLDHQNTMQYQLGKAGYAAGFAGKFLNGWPDKRPPPHFDRWALGEGYDDASFVAEGKKRTAAYGPSFVFDTGKGFLDDWEKQDERPWLLMLSPSSPHDPYEPTPRYEDKAYPWNGNPATKENDRSDKPAYVRLESYSEGYGEALRESQFRTLRTLDDEFEEMIERLTKLDELENTLVIYISDNGIMWAEHGIAGKGVPYTGSVRVPLYMRGPGVLAGESDNLVANLDIAPTVYAAAGVKPDYTVDGRNLLTSKRKDLLLEFFSRRNPPTWSSLVTSSSQYIEYAYAFREFYDLENDPFQLESDPSLLPAGMAQRLDDVRTCKGSACP